MIRLLVEADFLDIPKEAQGILLSKFNFLPTKGPFEQISPVLRAAFANSYNHCRIEGINYHPFDLEHQF